MASGPTPDHEEERVILVIGKTGHGKSTLANNLLGDAGTFNVGEGLNPSTQECLALEKCVESNGRRYKLKVIDTPGYMHLRSKKICGDKLAEIKAFLEDKARNGVNTVLITWKSERLTQSTEESLQLMKNDMKLDTTCFSIAFTGCEGMREDERTKTAEDFLKNPEVQFSATLAKDRYIVVGFPDMRRKTETYKAAMADDVANDRKKLISFVTGAQFKDKKLKDDLFSSEFWEMLPKFLRHLFF